MYCRGGTGPGAGLRPGPGPGPGTAPEEAGVPPPAIKDFHSQIGCSEFGC